MRRRVLPRSDQQGDLADHFFDATWYAETLCFNAHGVAKYVLSEAVREGGLQGRAHRRGLGRDLRRLSALPARHAALRQRRPGPGQEVAICSRAGEGESGLARPPAARTARGSPPTSVRRALGIHAVVDRGAGRRTLQAARRCTPRTTSRDRRERPVPGAARQPRRPAPARRPSAGAPVSLPVGQDRARRLHPDRSRRPHGDGALRRGSGSVPRSPRRRAGRFDARAAPRSGA